jgi:hypothetical protein
MSVSEGVKYILSLGSVPPEYLGGSLARPQLPGDLLAQPAPTPKASVKG